MIAIWRVDFRWAEVETQRPSRRLPCSSSRDMGVAWIRVVTKIGRGGMTVAIYRRNDVWVISVDHP